ncbi:hypothetical protein JCM31826_17150 [Thermaurantimonas aggregans]|uniref:Pilus assembly protein TadD n=1 Tax=Thermaurantimonas aggregans TaxID=2173829 RepID=A0A401XMK4_9FLAO|nr:tetratricopeptide repeat protein [Thermaurantimonas aggregans]MCX8148429.1 tetratricopeptide repeat protein [Thermaurantimonas aggregans]GCD78233.1 hypothetical protein JCM31826_17150 [Thermaurantimonas aggregans]
MYRIPKLIALAFLLIIPAFYFSCSTSPEEDVEHFENLFWANGDTLTYVGIETCKNCHYDIYSTFIHTGMGSSFGLADTHKSAIPAAVNAFFDAYSGYWYKPYFDKEHLKLLEFRLKGSDTIYHKTTEISYIIGSGHHTNSHIINCNGYLFQAPFTFYTQSGKLDLPPGFEEGHNSRYSRPIGLECMSCHNAMPTGFVKGSENKFEQVPMGIDCERCHGPGSGHVAKILSGNITDTSKLPDYSIVNPKRLPVKLRFELCQRCHLQGNAVLAEGKSFFDFRPGMMLREVMDVYLPRYEDDEHFIMASHADRLSQSKCFIKSKNKMDCTTCHNPHVSSRKLGDKYFNEKCQSCHTSTDCSEKSPHRQAADDNCVSCHMPVSGSIDIPHVTIHDHKIGIHKKISNKQKAEKIIALQAINNPTPTLRSKIKAYLQQFERFEALPWYLDSAALLLKNVDKEGYIREWIHLSYLRNDGQLFRNLFPIVFRLIDNEGFNTTTFSNENAWFWYRVAHLTSTVYGNEEAMKFYQKAYQLAPYHYDFKIKYALSLAKIGEYENALNLLKEVHQSIPHFQDVNGNIGYILMQKKEYEAAEKFLLKSLAEKPDYALGYRNLINLYIITKQQKKLIEIKQKLRDYLPDLYTEYQSILP